MNAKEHAMSYPVLPLMRVKLQVPPSWGAKAKRSNHKRNGIYDNMHTFRREHYFNGKVTSFINADVLVKMIERLSGSFMLPASWKKPWGTYSRVIIRHGTRKGIKS